MSLQPGQAVTVRAIVESGDVDLSAFDASSRVDQSANNGTVNEEVSLTGPGEFQVEARAVVDSTVRIETVEP